MPFSAYRQLQNIFDGLVKSPPALLEAGLHFNPAPLDKHPALGIQE
jgi:hypothetical protein